MAETSSSSSSFKNGSSIASLAPDHLFPILFLLPVDSILSFAMTCKKYRYLATSDNLWESVCGRDWGSSAVDVLKSSFRGGEQQLPWIRLYKQVSKVDSVCCYKLTEPDPDLVLPTPRASHSLNFVSGCLVLFGGGCEGGRHLDDTWAAYIGNSSQKMLKWQKIQTGIPSGRFGHTCVVIENYLVLFGGINDRGDRQSDTWLGQVSIHENLGISLSWRLLDVGSTSPPPRGAHAACCISSRRMVVHGGIGLNGVRLDDTWVIELSEIQCFGTWHQIVSHPSPPARSGHSLTCISETQTILFSGRGLGYEVLNDIWVLHVSEGRYLYVFGGMVDGLLQPAEPAGLSFDGELFLVELVIQL
ncbi:F-box/kelch-repeat protein [Hibiscus syriacus]|uniref:F-box/kelch-repeat protein n=1 Tax=Hibiscus syriacus TaxID=106335 RepID=A0A6A2WTG6_HIBSY|nr:F-box/kelch-repeat protein [Hibiscus syriacus]